MPWASVHSQTDEGEIARAPGAQKTLWHVMRMKILYERSMEGKCNASKMQLYRIKYRREKRKEQREYGIKEERIQARDEKKRGSQHRRCAGTA